MIKDLKAQMEFFEETSECFKKAYDKHISECAMLNKSMIRNSINTSTNISDGKTVKHNSSFERLKDITTESRRRRGNPEQPPLKETGKLYRGVIKRKNLVINTVGYGEYHNEGDGVPERRYFDTPPDFFETPEYRILNKKLQNDIKKCMRSSKRTIKI